MKKPNMKHATNGRVIVTSGWPGLPVRPLQRLRRPSDPSGTPAVVEFRPSAVVITYEIDGINLTRCVAVIPHQLGGDTNAAEREARMAEFVRSAVAEKLGWEPKRRHYPANRKPAVKATKSKRGRPSLRSRRKPAGRAAKSSR